MRDNGSICKLTIDGTDYRINEPRPFSPQWFSEKFNGPGVRYEIGICIQTGWICWVNGAFPCGSWPDLRISRDNLIYRLRPGEKVQADRGYGGRLHVQPTGPRFIRRRNARRDESSRIERMKSVARARHEWVNRRFKEYNCLRSTWRHAVEKHGPAAFAVMNITC